MSRPLGTPYAVGRKANDYGQNIPSPIPSPVTNAPAVRRRVQPIGKFPWEKPIYFNTRVIETILRQYTDPAERRVGRWLYSTWN